jgi:hypothetical protein
LAGDVCSGLRNRNPVSGVRLTGKNCRNTCRHTWACLLPHRADDTRLDFLCRASLSTGQSQYGDARSTCSNSRDSSCGTCLSCHIPHTPSWSPYKAGGARSGFLNKHRSSNRASKTKTKARQRNCRNICNNIFGP